MDIATLRAVLALHAALSGAPKHLAEISRDLGTTSNRVDRLPELGNRLAALAGRRAVAPLWKPADRALEWLSASRCSVLTVCDPAYPQMLAQIAAPPLVLFLLGNPSVLTAPQIAIVGSRKASRSACDFAHDIAADLVARDVTVTSGMAIGVDAAAHRGALDAAGQTVAVLGCGIDRVYPARHHKLANEIAKHGAIVSEFPFGAPPLRHHFPQRNRLIAGMSMGTLVVEAAERSGSISTAMHALEQGREVFAVPGSIHNPLTAGCHALIGQGAKLTVSVDDVIDELPNFVSSKVAAKAQLQTTSAAIGGAVSIAQTKLLDAGGWEPFSIDNLVAVTGLTVQEVSSMLLALELAGMIEPRTNGTYLRVR